MAGRRRLIGVVVVSGIASGLTGPLVSVAAVHLGAGGLGAGVAVAILQVPVIVLGLFGTRWLPRLPLRRTVTCAVALGAVGAGVAAAGSYPLLLTGRFAQGVGVVLLLGTAGYALVAREGRTGRGSGFGSFQAAWFAGIAVGPVAALLVASAGGDLVRATFATAAALAGLLAIVAALVLRDGPPGPRPQWGRPRGARPARRELLLSGAGQATRSGLAVTIVPLVGADRQLTGHQLILAVTVLGAVDVAAMLIASRLPRRVDRRVAMVLACGWGVLALILLALARTPAQFILACAVLGVTVGSTWVLPGSLVLDRALHVEAAFSWYRLSCDVGLLLGALAGGALAASGPSRALWLWTLPLLATAVLACTIRSRGPGLPPSYPPAARFTAKTITAKTITARSTTAKTATAGTTTAGTTTAKTPQETTSQEVVP